MTASRRVLAGALFGLVAVATPLKAEVAAETNRSGNYVRTVVRASASIRHPRIWSLTHKRLDSCPLNPAGDASGDLFPIVGEDRAHQRWPWVIWSHFNGQDFDLVWSRWLGTKWSRVAPLEASAGPEDAVDPSLAFGPDARPHAVWLARGPERAEVQLSIFLQTQWMAPFTVSDPGEDALNPSIVVHPDGQIEVSYDTTLAHVTKLILFARPMTITDDLTPFDSVATVSTTESAITKP